MGSRVLANGNKIAYGVNSYTCDTVEDLDKLTSCRPGSKAFVFSTGKRYIKNNKWEWEIIASTGGSGSGSGGDTVYEALTEQEILDILNG